MVNPPNPPSKVEEIKLGSSLLRGRISEELALPTDHFEEATAAVLKHHGIYQQDDRDRRGRKESGEGSGRYWIMMVRVKIPGGRLTATQWLKLSELADRYGNGTLRITNRQDIQFHGIRKENLRALVAEICSLGLTTLGACGDLVRNVLACPAPQEDGGLREALFQLARRLTDLFLPRTSAYLQVWGAPEESRWPAPEASGFPAVELPSGDEEPVYGPSYLPRKFKIAVGLPEDNCVDVFTNDLGFLAIHEAGQIRAYHVLVGGGLGMTPADSTTFPTLAQPLCIVEPGEVLPLAAAIVRLFRDYGNRSNRRRARLKYLVADWGIERFRHKVEEYYGAALGPGERVEVDIPDPHLGWHVQANGRFWYGLYVENGRVADRGTCRMKSAIAEICRRLGPGIRLTPMMSVLVTDIEGEAKPLVEEILRQHGVRLSEEISPLRQFSGACVALPTCGLAITDSERVLPAILAQLEPVMGRLGLENQPLVVHMTGCPNGCGRPYNAEVGLVGRAKDRYAIYLGGAPQGTRLGFLFADLVRRDKIAPLVTALLEVYAERRSGTECFGDFCFRLGAEALRRLVPVDEILSTAEPQ